MSHAAAKHKPAHAHAKAPAPAPKHAPHAAQAPHAAKPTHKAAAAHKAAPHAPAHDKHAPGHDKKAGPQVHGHPTAHAHVPAMLSQGSHGAEVKMLQLLLKKHGVECGPVDGIFGPLTQHGVLAFQEKSGLGHDGIVGPQTWGALSTTPAPTMRKRPRIIRTCPRM